MAILICLSIFNKKPFDNNSLFLFLSLIVSDTNLAYLFPRIELLKYDVLDVHLALLNSVA